MEVLELLEGFKEVEKALEVNKKVKENFFWEREFFKREFFPEKILFFLRDFSLSLCLFVDSLSKRL